MLHSRLTGRDLHFPSNQIVENQTGVTIPKLKVVALDNIGAVYPKVIVSNPNITTNFGVTYDDLLNGKSGQICVFGFMIGVDTSPWPDGTLLYSDINGDLSTAALGGIVAQVVRQDAESGVLYIVTEPNPTPATTAWTILGNTGLGSNNFIGTKDAADFIIKTNDVERARITQQGRVGIGTGTPASTLHLKSHTDFADSGLRTETFSLTSNSASLVTAIVINVPDNCVCRVEYVAIGRSADGLERAMFKRTGLFFRENSSTQVQQNWVSDQTIRSNPQFNVGYVLGTTNLTLRVKTPTADATYWTGHVNIEILKTNL
jgi:hypothetical protein